MDIKLTNKNGEFNVKSENILSVYCKNIDSPMCNGKPQKEYFIHIRTYLKTFLYNRNMPYEFNIEIDEKSYNIAKEILKISK